MTGLAGGRSLPSILAKNPPKPTAGIGGIFCSGTSVTSSIAPAGGRSEADFAVCCYAIRNSIAKEEVWAQVEQVGNTLRQVTDRLLAVGSCFSRAEQLVVIHDAQISPVLSPPEMAGLLNQHVEFYFVDDEAGEYKPFPPAYANTWLNHHCSAMLAGLVYNRIRASAGRRHRCSDTESKHA